MPICGLQFIRVTNISNIPWTNSVSHVFYLFKKVFIFLMLISWIGLTLLIIWFFSVILYIGESVYDTHILINLCYNKIFKILKNFNVKLHIIYNIKSVIPTCKIKLNCVTLHCNHLIRTALFIRLIVILI